MDYFKSTVCDDDVQTIGRQINKLLRPEWLRIPDAVRIFGISRSGLYELIASGAIKSAVIRKRGATRGIRILSYDSIAKFCEDSIEQTDSKGGFDSLYPLSFLLQPSDSAAKARRQEGEQRVASPHQPPQHS